MSDERTPTGRRRESSASDAPTGQLRPPPALALDVAGQTDKGRVRPGNEDSFAIEQPTSAQARARGTLLVVSDGMGGHAAGEIASAMAVETIQATYYASNDMPVPDAIQHAITTANSAIYDSAQSNVERGGMGCTVVVMVVQGSELTVGHVGDSRGYLIREGRAHQITRDHSWVAMQVESGVLTPEQAAHHPNRSLLMRALGRQASVDVEIGRQHLQAGDVLIICSDGLTGVVEDSEIAEYAARLQPADAAEQLIALANSRGAPDNVTVVAAAIRRSREAAGAGGMGAAASNAATMVVTPNDARTTRIGQPADDAATTRRVKRPPATEAERQGEGQDQARAATAAPASAPPGTPVVLARESVVTPGTLNLPARRRGYGRLIAGTLAVLGMGVALAALLLFRTSGTADAPRPAETAPQGTVVTTATPASKPGGTGAAMPPPVATGLPDTSPAAATALTLVPTTQATPSGLQAAPDIAGQGASTPTAGPNIAGQPAIPALAGTPMRPFSPPSPTAEPAVPPPIDPAPANPASTADFPPPDAEGDTGAADGPPTTDGDAPSIGDPAVDGATAPAEPSGEEPASAPAPAPAPSGPRLVVPEGGSLPALPGFRPRVRDKDD